MAEDSTGVRGDFDRRGVVGQGDRRIGRRMSSRMGKAGPPPFFVSVASKGFGYTVSLLFATLAGRSISVAGKGLKAIVGSGQWTVGHEGKTREVNFSETRGQGDGVRGRKEAKGRREG